MKKFLPKTVNNPQGFTLVELMVVVAIIAILAVVGLTLFSGAQNTARDGVRTQDLDSIAKALEVNKVANGKYQPLVGTNFAASTIPVDPKASRTPQYCILTRTDNTIPAQPTVWASTSQCPTSVEGASTVVTVFTATGTTVPANTTTNFRVCALYEQGTAPNIFCIPSQQ